jgi:sulfate permease
MSVIFSILLIPFIIAMFLAINMGGSGTSPAFAAAYGANMLRRDLIPALFGIAVFLGAILAGKKVTMTISKGILPAEMMGFTLVTIILIAISISLLIANLLRVPQSTSQSTVFALIGPAMYFGVLNKEKVLFEILPTWFITPVIAFIIVYLIGKYIYHPLKQRKIIEFEKINQYPFWHTIVIFTALYVAFAIGSNNVANASGPIVSMLSNSLQIAENDANFILLVIVSTLIIAPCFGIGSSIFGAGIVETTGKEIVDFGPLGATLISIVTASLLLMASVTKGIPTSLVQMNTAAIIALSVCKTGWQETLSRSSVKKLVTIWIIAPLISLILSFLMVVIADKFNWL